MKIYVEYGLDFDNNKYGFGRSFEIKNFEGAEYKTKEQARIKNISLRYFLVRIGRIALIISSERPRVLFKRNENSGFKIVYGVIGTP